MRAPPAAAFPQFLGAVGDRCTGGERSKPAPGQMAHACTEQGALESAVAAGDPPTRESSDNLPQPVSSFPNCLYPDSAHAHALVPAAPSEVGNFHQD